MFSPIATICLSDGRVKSVAPEQIAGESRATPDFYYAIEWFGYTHCEYLHAASVISPLPIVAYLQNKCVNRKIVSSANQPMPMVKCFESLDPFGLSLDEHEFG